MSYEIRNFCKKYWPRGFFNIPDPPEKLRIVGKNPDLENKFLCVVGTRKPSDYAIEACQFLLNGLANYPITIVSGLAYGIDILSHQIAMENNLSTISFPGSGLREDVLYPKNHKAFANEILESGGALISELPDDFKATLWTFPQRNRLMAAMSDAVLIVEANMISGTMITSRLATEYNKDVCTIPGSIFSNKNAGNAWLLKNGAYPITKPEDLLKILGFNVENRKDIKVTAEEKRILKIIETPKSKDELIEELKIGPTELSCILSSLELKDLIEEKMNLIWRKTG